MRPARFDTHAPSRPQSPRSGSFLCSPDLSSSRWQSLRFHIRDQVQSFSAAGPSDDPLALSILEALPPPTDKVTAYGSPRHRPGFSHSTPAGWPSPLLTEPGLSSTALPVLSPHASESSKRLTLRRTKRSRFLSSRTLKSQAFWLTLYFAFNLGLTLYNKLVLVQFPFPYTLTALHALCGTLGGLILRRRGAYVPAQLSARSAAALVAFSVLYAVNIAVSNVSLQMVTIPVSVRCRSRSFPLANSLLQFHQVVRAATPIFATALSVLLFGTQFTRLKILSLIPVMAGVALAYVIRHSILSAY